MDIQAKQLVFHSAVTLLVGLLVGAPYGRSINKGAPAHIVSAWRLAHGSLPLGAALGLAVSAVLSSLKIHDEVKWAIALSFAISNYSFCLSLPLAAIVGQRGLSRSKPVSNQLVFVGNMVGAGASLVGAAILVYATYASLF
jgi:hypothetical protein